MAEAAIRLGQGERGVEEAVSYAVSHRIRAEIMALLNEGMRTREELAHLIGLHSDKLKHHIRELRADGSIELAHSERVGNMLKHYYRAVEVPFYSDEEVAAMPPETKQALSGVALQAIMAEALAAFWAGKMVEDPRLWLSWRWFNVDAQGRADIADEQARSWARVQGIEAESAARCIESNDPTTSIIVTSLGYVRSRTSSTRPAPPSVQEQPAAEAAIKLGQGQKRGVEEAVSYSVGHRIRVEIVALLNECVRTPHELARLTRQSLSKVGHHIKELHEDGSIELAYVEPVRNTVQHYYRAVEVPFYSDEEVAAMPPETKQALSGVALQAIMAEALAAFWAGKMVEDPRLWLSWRWFNVDAQGRADIADEQARSWARVQGIEAESAARCIESNDPTTSIIVTSLGYVRSRTSSTSPATVLETEKLTRE